jgi:cysteine desulfurase
VGQVSHLYFDHHASTPLARGVLEAMQAAETDAWANASSAHGAGRRARAHLDGARRAIAESVSAEPADIVLTSGGTEAVCTAVLGAFAPTDVPARVVTTAIEHPAVSESIARLAARGARVTTLALPGGVPPDVDAFAAALRPDTALVALQWVNHETGVVLPVAAYAEVCRARGVPLVVDGAQAVGKLPVSVANLGVSALAWSASKLGGPHGAGAVWLARSRAHWPVLAGGGQERGRRPGTPDVRAAVGFGAASRALYGRLAAMPRIAELRDRLESGLRARGAAVNGAPSGGARVATVTHVAFEGLRGDVLVAALDLEGVCVSSGAACASGLAAPSPGLRAMYPSAPWRAEGALRFSLGPETTDAEVDAVLAALDRVLGRLGRATIQPR